MSDSNLNTANSQQFAKNLRKLILKCSTKAGSGHPTSSLSATDLMAVLFSEGFFKADYSQPKNLNNDKLIFSKGHASPLFFSLWTLLGVLSEEELMTFREFGSRIEGHPTLKFEFTEAPTGSLGQGLGVATGMAIASQRDGRKNIIWTLLGDSEMAEGSNWEAIDLAVKENLKNLVGIIDINRLGQKGETLHGHQIQTFKDKIEAFGAEAFVVDGHNLEELSTVYQEVIHSSSSKPKFILAKTLKGKGVSFLEDKANWHGKTLNQEELELALQEIDKA
jgi:transketolase